ncbi:PEP-CTERM sorting domain-containing protein [Roseateles paludis]|uniref:PEP-CTERM sorting domain-containing protein n=1 Tax=Roseateles paludis TaxID=3145238 RepID=A0ABV0FYH7_9BURK
MFRRFRTPGCAWRHWAVAALAAASSASHAELDMSWDMHSWSLEGTPSETLQLHAHIHNSPTSTERLLGTRFVSFYGEGLEGLYNFAPSTPSLVEQFAQLDLAPGESMDFIFGLLVPINGHVEPGVYGGGGYSLNFRDAEGAEVSWQPEASLAIRVVDRGTPDDPQHVPEPTTAALAALGLAAAGWGRRQPKGARQATARA